MDPAGGEPMRGSCCFDLVDRLPDLIWHVNTDGECDFLNRAWLEFTGRSREEQVGFGWLECVHPDDRDALHAACLSVYEGRRTFKREYRLRHRDGTYRWIASSGVPDYDKDGVFRGCFGSCHDIHERKSVEAELVEKQGLLGAILENVDSVVVACNREGRIFLYNRKVPELAGRRIVDATPEEWAQAYGLHDPASGRLLPQDRVPLYRALKGETVVEQEIEVRDGELAGLRLVANGGPLMAENGELLGAVVSLKDVTEQREAEEMRRRDLANKRVVADILGISLGNASLEVKVSAALEAVLLGDGLLARGAGFVRLRLVIPADDIDVSFATATVQPAGELCRVVVPILIDGIIDTGSLEAVSEHVLDLHCREFLATVSPLLASMAQRHRRAEKIIQLSRVVEQSSNGILVTDAHGTIVYANPALTRIRGYRNDEMVGAKPSLFKSGRTPAAVYRDLWSTISAGQDWSGELENRCKDGSFTWERVAISPIRDAGGRIVSFVATCEDLTSAKQAEQERKSLQGRVAQAAKMEAIGHLAGGIAHDFNNILVAILGFTELARNEFGPEQPKLRTYLDHSLRAALRAKDLVAQLLTFSRNTPLDARAVAPGLIVDEVVQLLRSTMPASLSITLTIAPDLPHVRINPVQLHQVIMNLAINARDATGGRGRLDIEVCAVYQLHETFCVSCHKGFSGDYVAIVVRDDGSGIPAEDRDRIFEPFFTTKDVGAGTGMGLSVVHGVVHFHDGHVTLSTADKGGSQFVVYLPAVAVAEQVPGDVDQPLLGLVNGRILVIDDEAAVVEFASAVLEGIGCRVTAHTDGERGWECFAADPQAFDLVIVDQTMPTIAGHELCRRMLARRPRLPVILWTGYSPEVDEQSATTMGIRRFMLKPITAVALRAAVTDILAGGAVQEGARAVSQVAAKSSAGIGLP